MLSSKLLPIFLLAITALAADLPALAHPPQKRGLKTFTLAKRQGSGNSVGIGSSCASITGNPEDIICEISGENVSCAPVCCQRNGAFVDGCPAGDQCVFEGDKLKCCPIGKTCGPRPTECANYGVASTRNGLAICPSATPTCTTRDGGAIACTGEGPAVVATATPTASGRLARPNVPEITGTEEASSPAVTSSAASSDEEEGSTMMETEPATSMPSASRGDTPSGTMNLPESATPTDEGRAAGGSDVGSSASSVVCDNVFGIIVATVIALGLFL
ncbi:hypothetical protein TWF718_003407 [Orbilia javanica]|uniref:Uncharacterized protein n=1 Tax=Orbilia javanica TaxID=47235 RepID=A0AAN8MP88_9PEZI